MRKLSDSVGQLFEDIWHELWKRNLIANMSYLTVRLRGTQGWAPRTYNLKALPEVYRIQQHIMKHCGTLNGSLSIHGSGTTEERCGSVRDLYKKILTDTINNGADLDIVNDMGSAIADTGICRLEEPELAVIARLVETLAEDYTLWVRASDKTEELLFEYHEVDAISYVRGLPCGPTLVEWPITERQIVTIINEGSLQQELRQFVHPTGAIDWDEYQAWFRRLAFIDMPFLSDIHCGVLANLLIEPKWTRKKKKTTDQSTVQRKKGLLGRIKSIFDVA